PRREQAEDRYRAPGPEPPARAHELHHPEDRAEDRGPQSGGQGEAFHAVEQEAAESLAIEAVLLLDHERRVEGERQAEEHGQQAEGAVEDEADADLRRARGEPPREG